MHGRNGGGCLPRLGGGLHAHEPRRRAVGGECDDANPGRVVRGRGCGLEAEAEQRTCREAARVWADRQVREADEHRAFHDWARSRTRLVPPALAAAAALEDLGLPAGAPPEAIKRRWRELARAHHPDHGGDAERFKAARRSYEAAMAAAGATP